MNTEREQELLGCILFLIDIVNRYSVFFGLINRDVVWLDKIWEKDNIKVKQDELLETLKKEYGVILEATTNVDVLGKSNENED